MTDKLYDRIKLIALLFPVLTCASAIVSICNIPYAPQITAVLAAISTALGDIVIVAKKLYDEKKESEKEKEGIENE